MTALGDGPVDGSHQLRLEREGLHLGVGRQRVDDGRCERDDGGKGRQVGVEGKLVAPERGGYPDETGVVVHPKEVLYVFRGWRLRSHGCEDGEGCVPAGQL